MKTKNSHDVLSKVMMLCWAAFNSRPGLRVAGGPQVGHPEVIKKQIHTFLASPTGSSHLSRYGQ